MSKRASAGPWIAAAAVIAIVVGGIYVWRSGMHEVPPSGAPSAASSVQAANAAPIIAHPIEQSAIAPATASTAALPALGDSDAMVASALTGLASGSDLDSLLRRQQVIARIVATIDALPRHALGTRMLPLRTPKGSFVVAGQDGTLAPGTQNAARYAPYMRVLESVDAQALVGWYVHAYPLFQQAYEQLGYPDRYFNDRLIVVIDDLLATPDLTTPPALVAVKGHYAYADPALESLSAGQRMLLRSGPQNEARLKTKLRAIRAQVVGQHLPDAPAAAATATP